MERVPELEAMLAHLAKQEKDFLKSFGMTPMEFMQAQEKDFLKSFGMTPMKFIQAQEKDFLKSFGTTPMEFIQAQDKNMASLGLGGLAAFEQLSQTLETVYKRQNVPTPLKPPAKRYSRVRPPHKLTDQEREVADMYLAEMPVIEIADRIYLRPQTVRNILWHIRQKQPDLLPYRIKPKQKSG